MLKKIFSFSNITLLVALALSTIAAWYSIIGLTAIFAGAVIPVIIMGSALEVAKVTTTVWLRKYWKFASFITKLYLVPAIVILALITSMGIFGFLSKAHMDQGITTGDSQAKLLLYDEKIKTERDNIALARKALDQMDAQVDARLSRGDSENSAERAVQIRRQQQNERSKLQKDISDSQKNIQKLNEERAPIAAENRKVEAEVGPIKYIAALIYGDNPDSNVLERAVRWVIILLVIVFDPLAIMLVISANQSKDWDKKLEEEDTPDPYIVDVTEKPTIEEQQDIINEEVAAQEVTEILPEIVELETKVIDIPEPINCYKCGTELVNAPGIGPFCPNKECDVTDDWKNEEILFEKTDPHPIGWMYPENIQQENIVIEEIKEEIKDTTPNFEGVKDSKTGEWIQTGPSFDTTNKIDDHDKTEQPYQLLHGGYVEYNGKRMHHEVLRQVRPDLEIHPDSEKREPKIDFGASFPPTAFNGDIFVRVDVIPNKVFKYNGNKWIETRRESTDTYLTNDDYIKHLIEKLATGEYDPDMLTAPEHDAVTEYIRNPNNN